MYKWILTVTAGTLTASGMQAQFTQGNFAVVRIGDGTTGLTGAGFQSSIFQFNTSLQTVNSSGVASAYVAGTSSAVTTIATGTAGLQLSGVGTSDGHLSRSADGSTLLLGGYSNNAGAAFIIASPNRSIARIGVNGTATVQQIAGGPFVTSNFRSVASINGDQVWAAGDNTGIVTGNGTASTNSNLTTASATNINNREVGIYGTNNSLFFGSSATTTGLYALNPSSPASSASGQVATNIIGGVKVAAFWMADRDATKDFMNTGLDTAYIIGESARRIDKYEYDGSSWAFRGSATIAGVGVSSGFISGRVNGANVDLFGVFDSGSAVINNNMLYTTSDTSVFGAFISLSGTQSLSAGTNYAFRGVALVPVPEPTTIVGVSAGVLALAAWVRRRRRIMTVRSKPGDCLRIA